MSTFLRIEKSNQEQPLSNPQVSKPKARTLSEKISNLFSIFTGRKSEEQGLPAVYYAEEPIEIDSQDLMSLKTVEKTPPPSFNKLCVKNVSGTDIGFVEVLTHSKKGSSTMLKTDMKRSELSPYPMFSATRMQESYQLEILISKTADCSVPLEATDPFLIEGAYRNQMAEALWDYHTTVEPIKGAEQLYDTLIRIGEYELPETLPAPLLKQLRALEEECQLHATADSVKDFAEKHRQTLRDQKDTVRLVTPPINVSGQTFITIHNDQVEVRFEGSKTHFTQSANF